MQGWSVKGHWSGEYAYDPIPGHPQVPSPVSFVLEVDEEWGGKFRGRMLDAPPAGATEVSLVKGEAFDHTLEFLKFEPVFYLNLPEGFRTLEECVREWWGKELDYPVAPAPVRYEGSFSPDGKQLTGTWHIAGGTIPLPIGGQRYALDTTGVNGRWHARRERAVP